MTPRLRFALAIGVLASSTLYARSSALAADLPGTCLAHAPEAAARSGLPLDIIVHVMRAESAGRADAISPKGAIGCMQIMPRTWTYLTERYGLGADPFDARMNMIGGALYLAELLRQFGFPGAYAAYNAGPGRYMRLAVNGVPLPSETVAYTARLGGAEAPALAARSPARWRSASLFLTSSTAQEANVADTAPATTRATVAMQTPTHVGRSSATLFPFAANQVGIDRH